MPIALSGANHEFLLASRVVGAGLRQTELSVPSIHCGGCVARMERLLGGLPSVERARVNLSTKRATVVWRGEAPPPVLATLSDAGFDVHLHDVPAGKKDRTLRELVRALAVAGFASANIMALSVAVWSGADDETRSLFHWISAAIALPCLVYSGRLFFRSAWQALRRGRTNMDVPISVGVIAAFALSLYDTIHRGPHAYFDAAVCLLFVLLAGRTLDHVMRERARTAVDGLARLAARGASVLQPDGTTAYLALAALRPGMVLLLAPGDRVPVDCRVIEGRSDLDAALVSGESVPRPVGPGDALQAGTLNLSGPLRVEAAAAADHSFLAEMRRLMEMAEAGRSAWRQIADRAAALYAPLVHGAALLTFAAWWLADGDIHHAITVAIAVLIVTCPCALGLAVPMVQIVAARRLFEQGVMIKSGGALERLAEIDRVVFDKTGTLSRGVPRLLEAEQVEPTVLARAAALARHSRHPYALSITEAGASTVPGAEATEVLEQAGAGLEGRIGGRLHRLGRSDWAAPGVEGAEGLVLAEEGQPLAVFRFRDELRVGAADAVAALGKRGLAMEILSGDHREAVAAVGAELDLPWRAGVSPLDKVARIANLAAEGNSVLMVGDGLNDGAAMAAAHVAMAPASASDLGRNAADIVFLRDDLRAIGQAVEVAAAARKLVRQNLALAVAYNALAVPAAVLGYVTPLAAAIAMSASSLLVIGNALRLGVRRRG